jgi:hypothetical protein
MGTLRRILKHPLTPTVIGPVALLFMVLNFLGLSTLNKSGASWHDFASTYTTIVLSAFTAILCWFVHRQRVSDLELKDGIYAAGKTAIIVVGIGAVTLANLGPYLYTGQHTGQASIPFNAGPLQSWFVNEQVLVDSTSWHQTEVQANATNEASYSWEGPLSIYLANGKEVRCYNYYDRSSFSRDQRTVKFECSEFIPISQLRVATHSSYRETY